MDNLEIRKMSLNDLEEIAPILETDFDDFWNYNIIKSELLNENSTLFIAKSNSSIVAFAGIWKVVDIMHLNDIVVSKKFRSQGIGKILLNHIINYTKEQNINELTLEVRQDNLPAINLYKHFNFKIIGERKNYYGANNNAIIMTLYIDKIN